MDRPDVATFAEQLLAVIDDGRRTATYKLATLLAIMDCCAEGVDQGGRAPRVIPTRAIADRVATLYWAQMRPFPTEAKPVDLRQISQKRATVITELRRAEKLAPAARSWAAAGSALPAHVAEEIRLRVEHTVVRYPLLRLQTIDGKPQPFIYDADWTEQITRRQVAGDRPSIRLHPGAGDHLIRLAPLVRPLVEVHWTRMVAGFNGLDLQEQALRDHLFGATRTPLPRRLRVALAELQAGRCFYCSDRCTAATAIDHFVPWSRWPNDAVENLVVAHGTCNSRKSDHLPGPDPLERWTARLDDHGADLAAVASETNWLTDRARTVALARSVYTHLPAGTPLWNGPGEIWIFDTSYLDLLP